MKIHTCAQDSQEWHQLRSGVITASEFDQIVDTKFETRTGEMPKSYGAKKLVERWFGSPMSFAMTMDMELGKLKEEEAVPAFTFETGIEVRKVGFITNDAGTIGCSPDGLIGENGGIEVKCPREDTHVKYLLAGTLPKDYLAQVHGSMYVTGAKSWHFLSYCRRFPPLILKIERDEEIIVNLGDALTKFIWQMDKWYEQLIALNGGHAPSRPEPIQAFTPDNFS